MAETKSTDMAQNNEHGTIVVANDVIAIIAGLAATEIEGVAGMSGGIVGGIAELLGKKSLAKGIKITVNNKLIVVDVNTIIRYGYKINDVCVNVQQRITERVETMTGMTVDKVNINVLGLDFNKEDSVPALPAE